MDRLQTQLNGNGLSLIDLPEQVDHIGRQAVGTRADREPYDIIGRDRRLIQRAESFDGSVGIGERLKIRDVQRIARLCAHPALGNFELLSNRQCRG